MARRVVGKIDQKVIDLLGLAVRPGTDILLGDTNEAHIKSDHPEDYATYFGQLEEILANPDYVAKHPNKNSIEYIKILGDHVLVAVRLTPGGVWYARTLFVMSETKVTAYTSNPHILKKC